MVLKRLFGSRPTRSLTVLTLAVEGARELGRGHRVRAAVLFGVAVLAWKWAVLGLLAGVLVSVLRGGRSSGSPA